jgi:hypothetical protein
VVWEDIYTAKDRRLCIEEYLQSLQVAGHAPHHGELERAGTPAVPAVEAKPRKSHYFTKYVCFAKGHHRFVTDFATANAPTALSPARHYYYDKDIDGIKTNEDGVITVKKLPMSEVVKHPGVMLIFEVDELGIGSAKLLNKWRVICQNALKWGGKILIKLPYDCNAWRGNNVFSQFCLVFGLDWVHREDEDIAFITNCRVTRWALHGGNWNRTQGLEEIDNLMWAEENWGSDEITAEIDILLEQEVERLRQATAPACAAAGSQKEPKLPAVGLRGVQAPAMPCEPSCTIVHRPKLVCNDFHLPLAVARKVGRKEVERVPEAREAMDKEYNKLLNAPHPDGKGKGVWDMDSVKEKKAVKQEAERLGLTVFFALLAELCFQKGSELVAVARGRSTKGDMSYWVTR